MNQDFIEIKEEIQNNNLFGTYMYEGLEVLISSGIKMMLEKDEKFKKDVEKALRNLKIIILEICMNMEKKLYMEMNMENTKVVLMKIFIFIVKII